MRINRKNRGFTLVELMIVVAIIGVLAALAIFGVRKYILNAKTAEARNSIGAIARGASMAFDRELMAGTVLSLNTSVAFANQLCVGSATATVPAAATSIQGMKYQSTPNDWVSAAGSTQSVLGWTCLKFSISDPQYFMYSYVTSTSVVAGTPGAAGDTFQAIANGDLDGNTTLSTFELDGTVQQDPTTKTLIVTASPAIIETNPDE